MCALFTWTRGILSTFSIQESDVKNADIADAEFASKLSEARRRLKETTKYLRGLRDQAKAQRERDKEWGGVFSRGRIYRKEDEVVAAKNGPSGSGAAADQGEAARSRVLRELYGAQRLAETYREQGRHDEANQVPTHLPTSS